MTMDVERRVECGRGIESFDGLGRLTAFEERQPEVEMSDADPRFVGRAHVAAA